MILLKGKIQLKHIARIDSGFPAFALRARKVQFPWCTAWRTLSGRAEAKQDRPSIYTPNISSHNSLSSKGFRAELRDRIFFHFSKEVRRSGFIVFSDRPSKLRPSLLPASQHCRPFSPSCFLGSSLIPSEEKNRLRSTTINQCDFAPFLCIHLSLSFFLHLSSSRPNFRSVLLRFFRHRSFLSHPLPSNLILFFLHLYASAIITSEPTVQIFNLVWQMADLETHSAFAGTKEVRSCMSIAASPRKFFAGIRPHCVCRRGAPARTCSYILFVSFFLAFCDSPFFVLPFHRFPNRSNVVSIAYLVVPQGKNRFISDDT